MAFKGHRELGQLPKQDTEMRKWLTIVMYSGNKRD